MNGPKEINIKNRTHYPFDDMVNTMDNNPDEIRICKSSLYLVTDKISRYIEESNGDK